MHLELEEKHSVELSNLQSSMALSFKEELRQVRNLIHPFLMPSFSQKQNNQSKLSDFLMCISEGVLFTVIIKIRCAQT